MRTSVDRRLLQVGESCLQAMFDTVCPFEYNCKMKVESKPIEEQSAKEKEREREVRKKNEFVQCRHIKQRKIRNRFPNLDYSSFKNEKKKRKRNNEKKIRYRADEMSWSGGKQSGKAESNGRKDEVAGRKEKK